MVMPEYAELVYPILKKGERENHSRWLCFRLNWASVWWIFTLEGFTLPRGVAHAVEFAGSG